MKWIRQRPDALFCSFCARPFKEVKKAVSG